MSKVYEKSYDRGFYDLNVTANVIDDTGGKDKRVAEKSQEIRAGIAASE
jgi:hypothetical protein